MTLGNAKTRYLLDTHCLLWWWLDLPKIGEAATTVLGDAANEIFVSAASLWEIATKFRIGKLEQAHTIIESYPILMRRNGFNALPISDEHGLRAGMLPGDHRDPFDRVIAAQAMADELTVITRDPALAQFGCEVLW